MRTAHLALVVWAVLAAAPSRAQESDGPDAPVPFRLPADHPAFAGEGKARLQNVEQLLTDWDVEGAQAELESARAAVGEDSASYRYYRGRLRFEQGDYAGALEDLEAAKVQDRPGSWVKLVKDTRDVTRGYLTRESAHFVVHYPQGKDEVLAPWALDALEAARSALQEDLGYAPPGKVRVEVVSNAGELSRLSTLSREAIRTTGTIAICKFNKLIVTSPKAVLSGYDWLDTLAHEYTHLVISRKSRNTVPIWMHEGLAKYLESRWRGPPGGAMTPSTLALLGSRVKKNDLVPFEKMHPSMALLPTAEDAATAFAEVFFAVKLLHQEGGPGSLSRLLSEMARGLSDKAAVEAVLGKRFDAFEKAWMASLRKLKYPEGLIPRSSFEKKELAEGKKEKKEQRREVSFGDFVEVQELEARKAAHLAEVLRERRRLPAAVELYARAHRQVGDRYESVSNKYALALFEVRRFDDARAVLQGSLAVHPLSASTNVHLGRVALRQKDYPLARTAYLDALAVNPMNPEVFLALYQVGQKLGDERLKQRALEAVPKLMNVSAERVPQVALRLWQTDDLVDGQPGQDGEAGPPSPDAGAR